MRALVLDGYTGLLAPDIFVKPDPVVPDGGQPFLWFGDAMAESFVYDQPVFGPFDAKGAIAFLRGFGGLVVGIVLCKGYLLAVGAPGEAIDAFFFFCDGKGLAAVNGDDIDLGLVTAVGEEGDPFAVRAPLRRIAAAPGRAGQLVGGHSFAGDPDLRVITVLLPICRTDSVC